MIIIYFHEAYQCDLVEKNLDIIQIPTFLCGQTNLPESVAKTGKIVNINNCQFCALWVMVNSVEKIKLSTV